MNRPHEFVEQGAHGERPGAPRTLSAARSHRSQLNVSIGVVTGFNAADEMLADPDSRQVFAAALKHGYALVTAF